MTVIISENKYTGICSLRTHARTHTQEDSARNGWSKNTIDYCLAWIHVTSFCKSTSCPFNCGEMDRCGSCASPHGDAESRGGFIKAFLHICSNTMHYACVGGEV